VGFCTTCGGEQESGAKFCTNCGTRANGGASAGSGAAVQPAPEAPPVTTTPSPALPVTDAPQSYPDSPFYPESAKQSSSGLAKGIAIVSAIVIIGCAIAYYFLAPQKPKGPAPIIDGMQQASSAPAAQTFGLEKYPGARPVSASGSDTEQVLAAFETNDNPSQVMGYYRVRFPVAQVTADPTHSTLSADLNGRQVLITADALIHGSRVRISTLRGRPPQ
jgi:hypothetical protein